MNLNRVPLNCGGKESIIVILSIYINGPPILLEGTVLPNIKIASIEIAGIEIDR